MMATIERSTKASAASYAGYDVLEKWDSVSYNAATRAVLARRLQAVPKRQFLSADEWTLLEAVCARLIPQPDRTLPIPITPWIDEALALNRGEGFRHDDMPPQRDAWRRGIAGIEGEARQRHGRRFVELESGLQDRLLEAMQTGTVDPLLWGGLPVKRFFVDVLLKTVAGVYYSHPAAWSEIGFGGPAGPRGYVRMGFDDRDPWEAKERT